MPERREGTLRPEFQDWYPSLVTGKWYPADELTRLVLKHHRDGSPQWAAQDRIPSNAHFEFRGPAPRERPTERTRHGDRARETPSFDEDAPRVDS
jgi:hypothetical protein